MKELNLVDLIQGLNKGEFTSVELVSFYLERIYQYDQSGPKLNSIAEVNPDALEIAASLDWERKNQGPRSLLHGIPIVVKDNMNTSDRMHTTAGSLALADLYAPYDATVVKKLRDAGAIILAKTNLSEFAYFMSFDNIPSGFSSRGGQVKHPYHEKIDPLGSSTGSAVSVAANLAPVSLGTETNGSLMAPAISNSLVSIKPTLGLASRYGIIPISSKQDTPGPMAKTVKDCAIVLDLIAGSDPHDPATLVNRPLHSYSLACEADVKGMRIGFLNLKNYPYDEEEQKIMAEAKQIFEHLGCECVPVEIEVNRMGNHETLLYEFKVDLNHYLHTVRGYTKMTCLADIIAFNKADMSVRAPYGQGILEAAEKTSGRLIEPDYYEKRKKILTEANKINIILEEEHLDCLVSTKQTSYAPIAGNPCICVPAKRLTDLLPKSLIFIGKKWEEHRLFSIASSYEKQTNYRIPPNLDQK